MGKLTLYYTPASMPSRAVLLLIRYLGIDVELKNIKLLEKEQYSEAFKKINPASKVPVIVDVDGFVLAESRAILAYLVNTRKPGDSLYPIDSKNRAIIDQRLYYDATVVFPALRALVRPILYDGNKTVPQNLKDEFTSVMKLLEGYLKDSDYFAGNTITIVDFSILANITSSFEFNFNFSDYPKITAWYKRMQTIPEFEENKAGAKFLADIITKTLGTSLF